MQRDIGLWGFRLIRMNMKRNWHIAVGFAGMACFVAMGAGCAGKGPVVPAWRAKAVFGEDQDSAQIEVFGNLAQFVPRFNPTPKLDQFLYGPSAPPGLMIRNAQGIAMLNHLLLVCDQGYPAVVGIDLSTGRSKEWQDIDHRPRCPIAILVGTDGRVYVADTTLRAVLVYGPTGCFVEQLAPSENPARSFRPGSLAMRDGVLYIGNLGDHRVDRYDLASRGWLDPLPSSVDGPPIVSPTGLAFTSEGTLLIADAVQARIFRMGADGRWQTPIGGPGRLPGQFIRPKQVACTPSGLICVTDAGRQSLFVFDAKGAYLAEVHEREKEWRGLTLPSSVLALPSDGLNMLMPEGRPTPQPYSAEWIIVSDTLDAVSLNLFGVRLPHGGGATRAAP